MSNEKLLNEILDELVNCDYINEEGDCVILSNVFCPYNKYIAQAHFSTCELYLIEKGKEEHYASS